jgi:hypothetical protein
MKKVNRGNPEKRAAKVEARAEKKMTKAKSSWNKAEATRKAEPPKNKTVTYDDFGGMAHQAKTNRLYARSARQAEKARDLKTKAGIIRSGGKK